MAGQEKWELSLGEMAVRLKKLGQKKPGKTRGGRSSGQGVKLLYIRDYLYHHATKEHPGGNKKSPGRKAKSKGKLFGSRLRISGACR